MRPLRSLVRRLAACGAGLLLAGGAALAVPAPTKEQIAAALAKGQELVDAGQADEAKALLQPLVQAPSADARLLLLYSSALILGGDNDGGRQQIDRALKADPTLRQAWLHKAALELVDRNYDGAYTAFLAAQKLDPAASDNALNLGAVLLLQGKLQPANEQFQRYLQANPSSADAAYLVATNYALAGYNALATQNLQNAIALDERSRLRARVDGNFTALAKTPSFQQILSTDSYTPPPGAYRASRTFVVQYDADKHKLLNAVLDAMRTAGLPFDANVEVTPDWALLWGELRVKVAKGSDGGVVEVTAPADRMTPQQWQQRTEKLFREILVHLAV